VNNAVVPCPPQACKVGEWVARSVVDAVFAAVPLSRVDVIVGWAGLLDNYECESMVLNPLFIISFKWRTS